MDETNPLLPEDEMPEAELSILKRAREVVHHKVGQEIGHLPEHVNPAEIESMTFDQISQWLWDESQAWSQRIDSQPNARKEVLGEGGVSTGVFQRDDSGDPELRPKIDASNELNDAWNFLEFHLKPLIPSPERKRTTLSTLLKNLEQNMYPMTESKAAALRMEDLTRGRDSLIRFLRNQIPHPKH